MAETFVLSFVEKLILLEERAGAGVHYRVMAPISSQLDDCLSVQKLARQIADFIGLSKFRFIVTFSKQKEHVGGHIDLSTKGGEEVFIEIAPEAREFPDSIAATLCHEICHKWLQVMGISSAIEMDNEILTDITTVYLGFGKIMLNGCELKKTRKENVVDGTRTVTETRTTGYLKRSQLAFVYRLVCAMRKVSLSEYMDGLNSDAANAVHACDSAFGEYYDEHFHKLERTVDLLHIMNTKTLVQQRRMSELNKYMEYVRKSFCETVDSFLTTAHTRMEELRNQSDTLAKENDYNPALRFLRAIEKDHELEQMTSELDKVAIEVGQFLAHAELIGRQVWKGRARFPAPSETMFNIIKCPKDGTKLRLPENSADLVVACPICNYRFAYNTTCLSFETSGSATKAPEFHLARRIWNVLKMVGASRDLARQQ